MDGSPDGYAAFGARLRMLRRSRGVSMRALTAMVGLSAHSNLADYECGRRLPPRDVVEACERALAISDGQLSRLREAALLQRSADAEQPAAVAGARAAAVGPDTTGPATPTASGAAAPVTRAGAWRSPAHAGLVAVVAFTALAGGWALRSAGLPWAGGGRVRVVEGVSTCDSTARIVDSVAVRTVPGPGRAPVTVGTVSLRFSPSCGLGWTRFIPSTPVASGAVGVELSVHRVNDGAITMLRLPQVVGAESDPLLTVPGCVYAQASVSFADGSVATARTSCRTG